MEILIEKAGREKV
jgi:hypothetical protein